MTDLDQLFETFSAGAPSERPSPIPLLSTDNHNRPFFVTDAGFLDALYRGDFTHCVQGRISYSRATRYTIVDLAHHLPPFQVVRAVENANRLNVLVQGTRWWGSFTIYETMFYVDIGSDSLEQGHELVEKLRDGLESRDSENEFVKFDVWSIGNSPVSRRFRNVPWSTVAENYPTATRTSLAQLMEFDQHKVAGNGKIILFHGRPGTGKTWAIRSLMTAWKEWSEAIIMIDPDAMLSSSEYFLSVMNNVRKGAVRLVVIEDADQIVEKDGTRSNDLSRMLNLTDGLVGASSDIIVLFSTNARPGQLDSALLRPGRCLATVGFESFAASEASERIGKTVGVPHTLAEIFETTGSLERVFNENATSIGQYL